MADKELRISISSDLKSQGFDAANKSIKNLDSSTDSLSKNFSSFVGIAAALGAVTLFKQQITETLDFADSLSKLSQKTGISADGLYSLSAAAKLSDVGFEDMSKSLGKFSKSIGENSKTFDKFGLSIKNNDGTLKDSFTLLGEVSDKFADMPDGASKATLAMQLFGKSGADMIPLLNGGSDSLRKFLGVMDQDTAKAAEDFNDSLTNIHLSMNAVYMKTIKELAPTLTVLSNDFLGLADDIDTAGDSMSGKLKSAMKGIITLGYGITSSFEIAGNSIGNVAAIISLVAEGNYPAAMKAGKILSTDFNKDIDKWAKKLNGLNNAEEEYSKNKEKRAKKTKSDYGLPNEDATKKYNLELSAKISGLEKQFSIQNQIENLNIESSLRREAITKPDAEFLKEKNEILSQIAKNQEIINLLSTKKYDENNKNDEVADLQKVNDLKVEQELQNKKLIASNEKYNITTKEANNQLQISIDTINGSDMDKAYQSLSKEVQTLIASGASLAKVGEYATKISEQIAKNDTYSNLQTEFDIRKQMAEVSLYGTQKETELENIRHDEAMTNLQRELETHKLNDAEYAKLSAIENQRNAQNSSQMYQFMLGAFENINKALDANFFDAMTGKFHTFGDWLKSFFKNIGNSIAQGLSRSLAGSITNSLQGGIVNSFKSYGGFAGATGSVGSLVGTAINSSDISSIMNNGGTYNADTNSITSVGGSVIKLATDGSGSLSSSGSDIGSLVNSVSTLKSAYGLMTNGISGTVLSGFEGISGGLSSLGATGAASGVTEFGVGFASPWASTATSGEALAGVYGSGVGEASGLTSAGAGVSSGIIGGAVGYGVGSIGDSLFGAKTQAANLGAVGGAIGSFFGPIGMVVGAVIGSIIGGFFGSTKVKAQRTGVDIYGNATADSVDGRDYAEIDYQKKSWFSSKNWTEYAYSTFNEDEKNAITQTIGVYDYLLNQMGETQKLIVAGGRFTSIQSFLDTNVAKAFISVISPNNLDEIYQTWVDYATSIDKTITEAFAASVSELVTTKRSYKEWFLGSGTLEQLKFTSEYLASDYSVLADSMGASGVTIDNYLAKYDEAIAAQFTAENITAWKTLGEALINATDANTKYQDSLNSLTASNLLPNDMLLKKSTDATQVYQQIVNDNFTMKLMYADMLKTMKNILTIQQFGVVV